MAKQHEKAKRKKWKMWELLAGILVKYSPEQLQGMDAMSLSSLCWIEGTTLADELSKHAPKEDDFLADSMRPDMKKYLEASQSVFTPG